MSAAKTSRKQSRRRPRTSSASKKQTSPAGKPELPLLDERLGRFADALALVETACSALGHEDETGLEAKVLALQHGIDALRRVYNEYDLMETQIHG